MSSIYTPRPAYQDLGGVVVLHSIIKRFPAFLHCEALWFASEGDLSQAQVATGPLAFRDAVATLPVNVIFGPISGGAPLTVYVSKPGFEEDFQEVASDIAVAGCDLLRSAPDTEKPFFLIFGKWADVSAVPSAPAVSPFSPEMPGDLMPPVWPDLSAPVVVPASDALPVVVPELVADLKPAEPIAAPAEVVTSVTLLTAADIPAAPDAPASLAEGPAISVAESDPPAALTDGPVASNGGPASPVAASAPAEEGVSGVIPMTVKPAEAVYSELRDQIANQAKVQAQALAQTQALVQALALAAKQETLQTRQDTERLLAGQPAALQAAMDAKLTQMQEQMANRQLMVARQAEAEQTERQMASLRHLQQEQATQLQALLVKLQNEQSEWQQETFRTLERAQKAQQQAQAERPAWFAMGLKELTRALTEQGETQQAALKAQQDQLIAVQKTISEWRSQRAARVDEPVIGPELGLAVNELTWKVEQSETRAKSMSARLNLLFIFNILLLLALGAGFVWSTSTNGAALAELLPPPTPTYNEGQTPTPALAVVPERTVPLTGVTLDCPEADRGRGYYDCTLGNGVAYPQNLSLAIAPDKGKPNGFFPSVTLGESQIYPDATTTLASLGAFEIGELKEFRINLPCAAALGCAPTTFVVRVLDSQAAMVPGSELLITSASP